MTHNCGSCKWFKSFGGNYGDCNAAIPKSTWFNEDSEHDLSKVVMKLNEGSDCPAWVSKEEFCEWERYTPITPQPFDCYESKNHEQKRFFGDVNKFCCECGKPIKVKENK